MKMKPRSSQTVSPLVPFVLLAVAAQAAAAPASRPSPAATPPAIGGTLALDACRPASIEVLQASLRKIRSRPARALKRAHDALSAGKFAQAVTLAEPHYGDALLGDHALWVSLSANLGLGLATLKKGSFKDAVKNAQRAMQLGLRLEENHPSSVHRKRLPQELAAAELLKADAAAGQSKWKEAQAAFERAFTRLQAQSQLALLRPESLAHYATACTKAPSRFCQPWLLRLQGLFPRASVEAKALLKALPAPLAKPSLPFHERFSQTYKSPDLDHGAFEAAMRLFHEGSYKKAIEAFQSFLDDYPKSAQRYRVRYWLAQALKRTGDDSRAHDLYLALLHDTPLSYYGMLAGLAIGGDPASLIDVALPEGCTREPGLSAHELLRIEKAELLLGEQAPELAALELRQLSPRATMSSPFLMYLVMLNGQAGSFRSGFSVLSELLQRSHPGAASSFALRVIFPNPYWTQIQKLATEHKLDPVLVLSLIKQESSFDSEAVSVSGALGLMQLMPATASDTVAEILRTELVQPEANLNVGMRYLRQLLTRFNGNIALAVAGYNAGPGAVDRWLRDHADKDLLEFIELIPYRETREYVAAIIRNYFWYSRRLAKTPWPYLETFWSPRGGSSKASQLIAVPPPLAPVAPAAASLTSSMAAQPAPTATASPAPAGPPELAGPKELQGPPMPAEPLGPQAPQLGNGAQANGLSGEGEPASSSDQSE